MNNNQTNNKSIESVNMRELKGVTRVIAFVIAVFLTAMTFYTAINGVFLPMIQRSVFLCLILALTFLWFPASKKSPKTRPSWIDYLCSSTAVLILLWTLTNHSRFLQRIPFNSEIYLTDIFAGTILILLCIEACRRTMGWAMSVLTTLVIAYAFLGPYMPVMLSFPGMDMERLIDVLYLTEEGLFSSLIGLAATILFAFIAFGTFLQGTGADKYYMDISLGIAGKKPGGPAKVACLSSAAMGTISGTTLGNVVTTGTLTIPLMKKAGFKSHEAAAIETVSSSGGQIMPPIMGTGAFIMAATLGVQYTDIVVVSIIPAILYYTSLWFFIDAKARKRGLQGLKATEIPSLKNTIIRGWHLFLPVLILLLMLLNHFTPFISGTVATILVFVFSLIRKHTRISVKKFLLTLENCAIGMVKITSLIACASIIVGIINQSGLMTKMTSVILHFSNGILILTIIIIVFMALVLGMGLPIVTAYIILSALGAPALIELGVQPLAAHLMIFWFCELAGFTPPIAMTAFAAAAIANARPMKTGFHSLKYGSLFYIIPQLFIFSAILDTNSVGVMLYTGIVALAAFFLYSGVLEGYYYGNLEKWQRYLLAFGSLSLFLSTFTSFDFYITTILVIFGLLVGIGLWLFQQKKLEYAK